MKKINYLIAITLFNLVVVAQTYLPNEWHKYCGVHYASTNTTVPAWSGWIREPAKDQTGLNLLDTVTMLLDNNKLNTLYNDLAALDTTYDLLELDGGLGSARDTARVKSFMNMIAADNGLFWKDIVYKQCNKLAQLPNSMNRMYYQLGNEITSPAYSRTIRYWNGQPYSNGNYWDQFIIPYFVEYFLAPIIEAIDSASKVNFGQKGKINICLGSITTATNPNAKIFLDALLNHTITGTYAPSLAGKKVYELIHIITIHYMMGADLTNKWETTINSFGSWFGVGRVRGVWSTEEVGIKAATAGRGASIGATATCRYLKWSIKNNYPARIARTNYYGWNTGPVATKINDFNTELFNFLGKTKLKYVDSSKNVFSNPANFEWHGFLNDTLNKGFLVALLAKTSPATPSQNITQIKFLKTGWGNISNITLTRYDTIGNSNIPVTLNFSNDTVTVSFPSVNVYNECVLLFTINTQELNIGIVENKSFRSDLKLYPNPSQNDFSIQLPDNFVNTTIDLVLYDSFGRKVHTENFVSKKSIHSVRPRGLSTGIYNVVIQNQSTQINQKLIIKN